jgi:hypothetical protein
MRVYVGLIMLRRVLSSGFLASFWSTIGLVDFFRYRPLLPIGWRIVQILRQRRRKTTNSAPTTLSAIQAASQSTFVNTQLYATCD